MDLARLPSVSALIDLALSEDLGRGDVTTAAVFAGTHLTASGMIVAREEIVVCGLGVAAEVFARVDPTIRTQARVEDGATVAVGAALMDVAGPAPSVLMAERTALNFLQRLCGIATLSRRFAKAVFGTATIVVDTRKTTPGLRALEKAAVRAGGCANHRADLGSGVLIKDNHIAAVGSITEAVRRAKARAPFDLKIEIEVESAEQLDEAIAAGAHIVLLDNMTVDEVEQCAVRAHRAGVAVEVSGGVKLDNIAAYARAGADFISVGALTHSVPSADLSLEVVAAS